MPAAKSIVLVTVDCLRADHVSFMGYGRPTTPFLASLARESFVVPSAIVAGAPTYYSFPSILASRYPLALGRDVLGLAPGEASIPMALKKMGYATAAFSAGNPYIAERFGYHQGFDVFEDFLAASGERDMSDIDDPPKQEDSAKNYRSSSPRWASRMNRRLQSMRMGPARVIYDELYFRYCQRVMPPARSLDEQRRFPAADILVDGAKAWLASIGESPFFLWLHLMDPHSPYYPKPEAIELMGDSPVTPSRARSLNSYWNRSDLGPSRLRRHRDEIVALYDAGVRWVDTQVARLVEALRVSRRWDNCVFALTADHGEEFLDHGGRYHPPSRLAEELIHVPLLLRVPGAERKELSRSPFSLLHLGPTLLDAAGVSPIAGCQGHSQWRALQDATDFDGPAVSECVAGATNPFHAENRMGARVLSIRETRFKLVLHFDPPSEQLFDLEQDPGEQAPLSPTAQKAVRRRLLECARDHLQRSVKQRDPGARVRARLHELQLERLRSSPRPAGKLASGS